MPKAKPAPGKRSTSPKQDKPNASKKPPPPKKGAGDSTQQSKAAPDSKIEDWWAQFETSVWDQVSSPHNTAHIATMASRGIVSAVIATRFVRFRSPRPRPMVAVNPPSSKLHLAPRVALPRMAQLKGAASRLVLWAAELLPAHPPEAPGGERVSLCVAGPLYSAA